MIECVCGFSPPAEPNPDCERCQLIAEIDTLRERLGLATAALWWWVFDDDEDAERVRHEIETVRENVDPDEIARRVRLVWEEGK